MEYALALVVLVALVAWFVLSPLRSDVADLERTEDERRAGLEAAKEAKYREIRDAELDHRMGKLSDADYRATDRELRGQAIEILKAIDDLPPVDEDEEAELAPEPGRRRASLRRRWTRSSASPRSSSRRS
jgi:hypothetical protein